MIVQELFSVLGLKIDKESWSQGDKFLSAVKAGFAGVVAGFGIHAVVEMVNGVSELADTAGKTAQKLGITTEAVQELGYAAKLSDIEQDELNGALFKFSRGLQDVAKDGSPVNDALKTLGVNFKDLKGESLDQNLEVIADAFQKMPDGPKKAAVAMNLFGKSGTKLIPLLNSGKEGIVELRNEAEKLGIVVSEETAKQFEEFNDQQTRLSETWRGIKTQVVSALLPSLMALVDHLQEWVEANREVISNAISTVVTAATYAIQGLAAAIEFALKFLSALAEDTDVLHGILIAVGIAFGVMAIQAIAAWVAAAAPLIAFVALVAGVYIGIKKLIAPFGTAKRAGQEMWDSIKKSAGEFLDAILSVPGQILEAFEILGQSLIDALVGAFDAIVELARDAAGKIWDEIKDIPIIGKLAQGAEALVGGGGASTGVDAALAAVQQNQETVSAAGGGGGSVDLGDINMTVNAAPGMDTEQLAELAAAKADQKRKDSMAQAYDSMRGGRR